MNTIETKEIRGLNFRNIWGFVLTTATIIICLWRITAGYADNIKEQIAAVSSRVTTLELQKPADDRFQEFRLKTIELQIGTLTVNLDNLRNQVNTNTKILKSGKEQ